MADLSKELGVKYVLEGSLRKAGDQMRITTQLIDATKDQHLWAERYDRSLKDIFAVQDEIVQKIVTTLKLQLPFWEGGYQMRRHTDNLEAYDFYLRGLESIVRAVLETKKEANGQARQMFERALELDPTYAEAYAGLGGTYFNEWFFQWNLNRAQTLERALELLQRAIPWTTPCLYPTTSWPMSISGISNMTKPWPRYGRLLPSIPTTLTTIWG